MDLEHKDIADLFLQLYLFTILAAIFLCLYWSHYVSLEVQSIYINQEKCGSNIIERDTLRNMMSYTIKLDEEFKTKIMEYAYMLIGMLVLSVIVLGILVATKKPYATREYSTVIALSPALIVVGIALYFATKPPSSDVLYKDYKETMRNLVAKLYDILNMKRTTHMLEYGLEGTFDTSFVKKLVERWKSSKAQHGQLDQYTEQIYTNTGNLEELERYLFTKDGNHKITGITETGVWILVGLLSPSRNIYDGEEKQDIDFIYDGYKKWACANNEDFCTNLVRTYLPEISDYDKYPKITDYINRCSLIAWTILIIIAYILFKMFGNNELILQLIAISFVALILLVFIYYITVIRGSS